MKFSAGTVQGYLDHPTNARDGLLLAHGAGGNAQMPLLAAFAAAFYAAGIAVLRIDLPFRQKRPTGPPAPAHAAADRAGIREALDRLREIVPGRIFAGGQSYGGRQVSMLAAEELALADTLLLLSYPLHPPGKPDQLRTAHWPSLRVPTMFVHGGRDPFATSAELEAAVRAIPAAVRIVELPTAGHDLARGRFDVTSLVVDSFLAFQAPR